MNDSSAYQWDTSQYKIINLTKQVPNTSGVNLYGVQFFDNKKFMFWFKNNIGKISRVIVIIDAKNENVSLENGAVVLSLKGLNNYDDIKTAIKFFIQIMKLEHLNDIEFRFVIENTHQQAVVESVISELQIPRANTWNISANIKPDNKSNVINQVEEDLTKRNFTASGSTQTIIGSDGTNYTVVDGEKVIENVGTLTIEEEKLILLKKMQQDSYYASRMQEMTKEELDSYLTNIVVSNRTQASFANPTELRNSNNDVAVAAQSNASIEDGQAAVIATDPSVAVVKNSPSNTESDFTLVEKNAETGKVQASEAQVRETTINSGGYEESTYKFQGQVVDSSYKDPGIKVDSEMEVETLPVYYIDEETFKLYDSVENYDAGIESQVTKEGCRPDLVNYSLLDATGKEIGKLANVKSMDKTPNAINKERANAKVLRLVKTNNNDSYKSAAFVSLPIIMFILSALLLLSSAILYFVFS